MKRLLLASICGLVLGLAPAWSASIPRPSPEYVIKLTTGQQVLLSSMRGNVVVLMFVSTECPHCRETSKFMEGLLKEHGPRGLQVAAVAFNEMAAMLVPDFVKRSGLTFPVGYDSRDSVFTYLQRSPMLRTYVPIMVFIDRNGVIRGQYVGDDKFFQNGEKNIRAVVEQLLNEPAKKEASSQARSKKGSS